MKLATTLSMIWAVFSAIKALQARRYDLTEWMLAAMAVIEELSRRSLAIAVPYIMAACYGGMNMMAAASERQKREYLPRLARGEILFAYGLTEPDIGADLASVKAAEAMLHGARLDGGHAVDGGVELGADQSQGEIDVRREDQHHEPGLERDAAVDVRLCPTARVSRRAEGRRLAHEA